jgi:aminoglycoside phosphotransferase (APT) family kinase protein
VVASGDETGRLGVSYLVLEFIEGETIARRILREDRFNEARQMMARQCGRILAAIHSIDVAAVPGLTSTEPLPQARAQLAQLGEPHPAFELGSRWLEENQPARGAPTLVHGDFRNGNLIVGEDGVRAVLDWELAHLGDPVEDLAWLCVRAWRFGGPEPVGGFGSIDDLLEGYREGSGVAVDRRALDWWIAFGTLHWGIICIAQALTHLSGAARSVELAAIGRRVCEVESDLLELLPWTESGGKDDASAPPAGVAQPPGPAGEWSSRPPHDAPSAAQLLEAVREFLDSDVLGATEGRVRFHVRVAANVIAMVGRELQLGTELAAAHALRLAGLGVSSEAELASAIRAGAFADRLGAVSDSVRATVAGKLAVANPAYRQGPAPPVGE